MPAVARVNDLVNTVHPVCTVPGIISVLTGSQNVIANNLGCHRVTDLNTPHTHCPPVFSTPLIIGSQNVFINNLNAGRVNDIYSCGAQIITGSQNIFVNG